MTFFNRNSAIPTHSIPNIPQHKEHYILKFPVLTVTVVLYIIVCLESGNNYYQYSSTCKFNRDVLVLPLPHHFIYEKNIKSKNRVVLKIESSIRI